MAILTTAAAATPWCTDLGPVQVEMDGDVVTGQTETGATIRGTETHVVVERRGRVLYTGPFSELTPTKPGRDPRGRWALAGEHAARMGVPLACGPAGRTRFRVGLWPDPVPLATGQRVTSVGAERVRVRGADGTSSVYLALPADQQLAGSLAQELTLAFPHARTTVGWQAGVALLVLSTDDEAWRPASVTPRAGSVAVLPALDLALPASAEGLRTDHPALGPGTEAAAALNAHRREAGLTPLRWDDDLGLAAVQHAAYVARNGRGRGRSVHAQRRGAPLFLAETAADRGADREVVWTGPVDTLPEEVVHRWLAAPFHRVPLLDPRARRIGAARVGGVWVADITLGGDDDSAVWPAEGTTAAGRTFVGRENPDPLPLMRYPDRVWPVGFPVTVWTPHRAMAHTLTQDGQPVAHWVVSGPLGQPREAVHLIPKEPLQAGATVRASILVEDAEGAQTEHTTSFTAPSERASQAVPLPPELAHVVRLANAQRRQPLQSTRRSAALGRMLSARTRAMREGLDPARLRDVSAIRAGTAELISQLCYRPDDVLELDASMLDSTATHIAVDPRAVTLTWRVQNGRPQPHLRWPRVCVFLFGNGAEM
ncbi:MAG: CAP domain-containing protein [Myxococcales bacterium]|nr:CAP domain-containing protein [Myxococcales bacterium]